MKPLDGTPFRVGIALLLALLAPLTVSAQSHPTLTLPARKAEEASYLAAKALQKVKKLNDAFSSLQTDNLFTARISMGDNSPFKELGRQLQDYPNKVKSVFLQASQLKYDLLGGTEASTGALDQALNDLDRADGGLEEALHRLENDLHDPPPAKPAKFDAAPPQLGDNDRRDFPLEDGRTTYISLKQAAKLLTYRRREVEQKRRDETVLGQPLDETARESIRKEEEGTDILLKSFTKQEIAWLIPFLRKQADFFRSASYDDLIHGKTLNTDFQYEEDDPHVYAFPGQERGTYVSALSFLANEADRFADRLDHALGGGDTSASTLLQAYQARLALFGKEIAALPRSKTILSQLDAISPALQPLYLKIMAALEAKNFDAFAEICAPDFQFKTAGGQPVSLDRWRDAASRSLQGRDNIQVHYHLRSADSPGDNVMIVTGSQTVETGDSDNWRVEQNIRDTWTRKGQNWLLKSTEVTVEDGAGSGDPSTWPDPALAEPDGASGNPAHAVVTTPPDPGRRTAPPDPLKPYKDLGVIPPDASPNGFLTEQDLKQLIDRVMLRIEDSKERAVTVTHPHAIEPRLNALAALVKVTFSDDEIKESHYDQLDQLPPDFAQVPAWGRDIVRKALTQSWWDPNKPIAPMDNASWTFIAAVLEKMPWSEKPYGGRSKEVLVPEPGAYTGLILDTTGLDSKAIERAQDIRILDPDGQQLYPMLNHLPDSSYRTEKGLASYITTPEEGSRRTGSKPLTISVVKADKSDYTVSREDAQKIREANQHGHFFERWAICVQIAKQP